MNAADRMGWHDGDVVIVSRTRLKGRSLRERVKALFRLAGGPGSGNFGHAGRPGEVGGSSSGSITLSKTETRLIDNWAWPNAAPEGFGLDYEQLRDPQTDVGQQMTQLLEKLPVHDGVTYRGVSLTNPKEVERLVSAKGYELKLHSSASTEFDTAFLFADAQSLGGREQAVIMEMHGRGRDIAAYLPEDLRDTKEVVMTAGTRYRFAGLYHEEHDGLKYMRIKLQEQR